MKMNQKGFGLLEMVISVGLLSVVTYGIMTQTESLRQVKESSDFNHKISVLAGDVKSALSEPGTCESFVGDVPFGRIQIESGSAGLNSGVVVGGEIKTSLFSPYKKIPNPDYILPSTLPPYISQPILVWDANAAKYKKNEVALHKIQLIKDGYQTFLRLTFEKPSLYGLSTSSQVNQDIIIRGTLNGDGTRLIDCLSESKLSAKQICEGTAGGYWTIDQKCLYTNPTYSKKDSPPARAKNLYIINSKLVTDNFKVNTVSSCITSNCYRPCNPPNCPAGSIEDVSPRLVVNDKYHIPLLLSLSRQKCTYQRNCLVLNPLPSGIRPVGTLLR